MPAGRPVEVQRARCNRQMAVEVRQRPLRSGAGEEEGEEEDEEENEEEKEE